MCLVDAKPIQITHRMPCYKIVKKYTCVTNDRVQYRSMVMNTDIPLNMISGEFLYKAQGLKRVNHLGAFAEVHGGFIHSYARLCDALWLLDDHKTCYINSPEMAIKVSLELWECAIEEPNENRLPYVYMGGVAERAYASESVRFVKLIATASNGLIIFVRDDEVKECVSLEYANDGSDFMHCMLKLAGGKEPGFLGKLRIKLKKYIRDRKIKKNE